MNNVYILAEPMAGVEHEGRAATKHPWWRAGRPCEDGPDRPSLYQATVATGSSTASKSKFSSPVVLFTAK
jgi:hypothetical protein